MRCETLQFIVLKSPIAIEFWDENRFRGDFELDDYKSKSDSILDSIHCCCVIEKGA